MDQWPNPRTVVAEVAGNYSLRGDPAHLDEVIAPIVGFVEAPHSFHARLPRTDPDLTVWNRVIHILDGEAHRPPVPAALVRRITAVDEGALQRLPERISWIFKTLGGPAGLATKAFPQRRTRTTPSWTTLAIRLPSRLKNWPIASPRPPCAEGEA